jgi:hypothetical protein
MVRRACGGKARKLRDVAGDVAESEAGRAAWR